MIEAGKPGQISWGDGNWIFLDIGFSGASGARGKTCGLVIGTSEPECVAFDQAKARIVQHIVDARSAVNLVIEAPLSVCFTRMGNPAGRSIERKDDGTQRFWFTGPGSAVMVAAMYLIRGIMDAAPSATIRLFEAFISYKKAGARSDHRQEASMLRDVVMRSREPICIVSGDPLKSCPDDELCSAFRVIGLDCGVPAVIVL